MFDDDSTHYHTSLLNPGTIRWINKRQSNNSNSVKAYLFPPLALEIYERLTKMEEEFAGNKRIAELYEVVKFVVEYYDLERTLKRTEESDPHQSEKDFLNSYVGSDRSGGKEFAEYLALNYDKCEAAMTSFTNDGDIISKKGDIQELNMRKLRLQAAFDELCNYIRRKRINQKLAESSGSDIEKYNAMVDLFGINHFKTNAFEKSVMKQNTDRSKKYPNLVIEKTGMRNYKKEGYLALASERRKEVKRVEDAAKELNQLEEQRRDPKTKEKLLKFWEQKGELLPMPRKRLN